MYIYLIWSSLSFSPFIDKGRNVPISMGDAESLSLLLSVSVLLPEALGCSTSTSHIYSQPCSFHMLGSSSCSWGVQVCWESCSHRQLDRRNTSFSEDSPEKVLRRLKASITGWNSFSQISGKPKWSLGVSDEHENFTLNCTFFPTINLITH